MPSTRELLCAALHQCLLQSYQKQTLSVVKEEMTCSAKIEKHGNGVLASSETAQLTVHL